MKRIMQLSILLLSALSVMAQDSVTILGHVTGDTKGYDNIYYYSSGSSVDSTAIVNGEFKVSVPFVSTYTQLFFTQFETNSHGGYRPFPVLIDRPGTIRIDMNIEDGLYKSKITGNKTAALYNDFLHEQNEVYQKIGDELTKLHGSSAARSMDRGETDADRDSLVKTYMGKMVTTFINAHPDDFVSVYILGMNKYTMDTDMVEKSLAGLSPEMRQSKEGNETAVYLAGLKNAVPGKEIKDFVLTDVNGKTFDISTLKGKYVWIDFWASWCGPCKQAFPHMREIYNKYKSDQFELIGISVDETKAPWLKSVEEIKNPWPQLWDDKSVAAQFAVAAYPTSFLIGPDGKIILKEVGFENGGVMEKKLDELFAK